ncbi:MAG: hypothetical protein WBG90_06560 [Saonia sp.]
MNEHFSMRRIALFIYRDMVLLKGAILTALSVVGGLMVIAFLFSLWGDRLVTPTEFSGLFAKFYVPLGILFSFAIFKEAHNKKANHFYYAMPVSPMERLAATWLATSIIYTAVFTVFAFLVGQFTIILGSLFSKTNFHLLPLFSEGYWQTIKFYIVAQPVFLLGAIAFTKNRIGKTILLILLIVFGLFVYNGILFSMFNMGYDMFSGNLSVSNAFDMAGKDFSGFGKWFWVIVLGPVLLLATYFKLIEKEVY